MQFKDLNIMPTILKALENENYTAPTPIQEEAIPVILSGRDLLGCAQTGTGKTAAFAIPTLQLLSEDKAVSTSHKTIRTLIITPTRELALQIYESFCTYGKYTRLKYCVVYGGVSQKPQEEALQRGVDILVATPGRLNDLINQRLIDLAHIKILILDEADRMLDMGFINDVKKIIAKTPAKKQTLLFSATMPPDIARLSNTILSNPARIDITPVSSTVDTIEQYLYYVDKNNKKDLLVHLLKDKAIVSALVFTRTKHGADRIVKQLAKENITAQAIHGDKSQGARQQALNNFKNKNLRVLIATDIAARGIDIDELSHVFNYDIPNISETYVHRIGRTGRAGLGGVAITFCDFDEKELLVDIEKLIGKHIEVVEEHPYPLLNNFPAEKTVQSRRAPSRVDSSQRTPSQATLGQRTSSQRTSSQTAFGQRNSSQASTQRRTSSSSTDRQRTATKTEGQEKYNSQPASPKRTSSYASAERQRPSSRGDMQKSSSYTATPRKDYSQTVTAQKPATNTASSQKAPAHTTVSKTTEPKKKKFRMTADGEQKEKRSNFFFSRNRGR